MIGQNWRCAASLLLATLLLLGSRLAQASVIAADAANDPAYAAESGGAWKGLNPGADENPPGTDDGGFGFQTWNFSGGFHYPEQSPYGALNHFIDGVDFTHSSFNNLGAPAFALTNANVAFGGSTSRATRVLDAPLTVGSVVSLNFDNPELRPFDPFSPSGFVIRLNSGGGPKGQIGVLERFGFFTTFGFNSGNWSLADSAGLTDTGLTSSQTTSGGTFRFTLTGAESYSLEILPLGGSVPLALHSGNLVNAGTIDSIEVLMFENGSGNGLPGPAAQRTGEREFYFNNLSVQSSGQDGDYDSDGDADGADFLLWQETLGSATELGADGDGNGVVDAADLGVWSAHFGAAASASESTAMTIPEPALVSCAAAALVALITVSRRLSCSRR